MTSDPEGMIIVGRSTRWQCQRCGKCCQQVVCSGWFDELDLEQDITDEVSGCSFLDRDNLCSIHESRPPGCRRYPFLIHRGPDGYQLAIHDSCPGSGGGDRIDIEEKFRSVLTSLERETGTEYIIEAAEGRENLFRLHKIL